MRITEAMSEIKLAGKKIQTNMEFISRNLVREERMRDPFEKDGTTQAAEVAKALQSTDDLQKRIVALRSAIAQVNQRTRLSIEGVDMSVAEWLVWRRDVLPIEQKNLQSLVNSIANLARESLAIRRQYAGGQPVETPPNWVINVSEKWLMGRIQRLNTIEETLDGQLSILNATTEIDI